ncbi:hypothetical protein L5F41_11100 [Aliarcobacter butzleri]|uniref:hypothetical protein n=1 Tax=Aliarcobacter butzleri TaxID=28197 RepID=UPI001ED9EA62|nr:hypothetical protein [Aliarcobacter butzleri]MCG3686575.1 hypothetical protein [Aliarcobacter butzleri]MCG3702641.1 hypothetical protein [Aliarcobacter butzleri]
MSMIENKKDLEQIIQDYKELLLNLDTFLKKVRPRSSISKTKLNQYMKKLDDITSLDENESTKLITIINKYNSIGSLLKNNNVKFNESELIKIIEGSFSFEETDDNANDILFELIIANRFLSSKSLNEIRIDMSNNCDLIINDEIAIECKYIHSQSNMIKNIDKAIKQINKRISNKQAKYGFVALDLTHICQDKKFYDNIQLIFKMYLDENKKLSNLYLENEFLDSVISNKNFQNSVHAYLNHTLETTFRSSFDPMKLNTNIKAVIYQCNFSFSFSYNEEIIPISSRNMTFYLNDNLNEEEKKEIENLVHSLAVGI